MEGRRDQLVVRWCSGTNGGTRWLSDGVEGQVGCPVVLRDKLVGCPVVLRDKLVVRWCYGSGYKAS